jgi:trk system potassium uptake protein TrkA
VFVATTGADDVNLVSCEIASLIHDIPRVIARVNNPKNERIFHKMGIEAVSSTTIIAQLIEREVDTESCDVDDNPAYELDPDPCI